MSHNIAVITGAQRSFFRLRLDSAMSSRLIEMGAVSAKLGVVSWDIGTHGASGDPMHLFGTIDGASF